MTTIKDRPNTALLVVDVQNGVVGGAYARDAVVSNIRHLVERARQERVPVVWVQHSGDEELVEGSPDWQIVPELTPDQSEPLIGKRYGDSFEATDLEDVLAGLGVGRLVVTGAETDACIRSTLHGAFTRGYDTTLVGDAHRRQNQLGRPAGGPGHRPHQPVLELPGRTRPHRGHGRDRQGRLQPPGLSAPGPAVIALLTRRPCPPRRLR